MTFPTGQAAGALFGVAPNPAAAAGFAQPAATPGFVQQPAPGFVAAPAGFTGMPQAFPGVPQAAGVAVAPGAAPAAPSIDSLVGGISSAKVTEGGNYHRVGHYIHRINGVKPGTTRKGRAFLAFEMIVLHVNDNVAGQGHTVGESVTYMIMRDLDSFLSTLKKILSKLANLQPHQITEDVAKQILGNNMLDGMIVEVFARNVTTKKNTNFTDVDFRREVGAQDLLHIITPEEKQKFFPNGEIEAAIAQGKTRV